MLPRAVDPPPLPGPVRFLVAVPVFALLVGVGHLLAFMAAWSTSNPIATVGLVSLLAAVGGVAGAFLAWVFVGLRRPALLVRGAAVGAVGVLALVVWVAVRAT